MSEQTPPPPTPAGTLSPDGNYRWDGSQWQAVAQPPPPPPSAPQPPVAVGAPMVPPAAVVQKKGHMGRNLGIGCLGLIVLIVIIVAATSGNKSPTASTPAAPDKATAGAAAPPATHAAPAPKVPVVLLDLGGSGTKTTQKFTAAGDWDLNWTYDCSAFAGGSGNFAVLVYNGDGSPSSNGLVNQLGKNGADVEHYHTGGTFYLNINSECSWHLTAKG